MAFADPQVVTINAVAQSLARINPGADQGVFQKDDTTVKLTISHRGKNRYEHRAKLDHSKIAADPFIPAQNQKVSMSFSLLVNVPIAGYTITEQKQIVDGFIAWASASSGANILRLLGGEN